MSDATDTLTLTDFLLARITEESRLAQSVLDADSAARIVADLPEPHFRHVVTWGPIRILAECEAKRQIVELHGGGPVAVVEDTGLDDEHGERIYACGGCGRSTPCPTIRALASVYADHAEFREEWAL